ncbi:MAG: catalase [Solobacterium sp.]|nr:catalase [Solobacterium sp.]
MIRFLKHIQTVNAHRREVRKNCFKCGLYYQGLTHDLSKYSYTELKDSVEYFHGDRSPYHYEKLEKGFALGWLHHKGINKHHFEYWYDIIDGIYQPLEMPDRYIAESICDRVAACKTYQKDKYTQKSPIEYFETVPERNFMHPKTQEKLRFYLQMIADKGEDATFRYIKEALKNNTF